MNDFKSRDTASNLPMIMKKILLFLIVFTSMDVMANTQAPNYTDVNNSCRERGVAVSATSSTVKVDAPAHEDGYSRELNSDVNVRVTTNKGSYNYDSRSTGLGGHNESTYTNHYSTYSTTPGSDEKIEKVEVMCYDR